jgi:hypothetical protein
LTKSFGRRGLGTGQAPSASPAFPSTTRSHLEGMAQRGQSDMGPNEIAVEKEGGKLISFVVSCASGLTFSIIASGLFVERDTSGIFASMFFMNIESGISLWGFLPFLFLAARVLADVTRFARIPRGFSDVLIGAVLGASAFLPYISGELPVNWRALVFVAGGALGGFTYWRSRGYPGLKRKYTMPAEIGFGAVKRIRF